MTMAVEDEKRACDRRADEKAPKGHGDPVRRSRVSCAQRAKEETP